MILGPVSLLDCLVFCVFLTPQLIIHVGLFRTVFVVLKALPFLLFRLPVSLAYERFYLKRASRPPFVQRASFFEDVVVRCVRYAFACIPANIGRVFFSKPVALPFLRFRMLRHGYLKSPVHWQEFKQTGPNGFKGLWLIADPIQAPDMVLYYVHGGGFAMGSCWFYLEFLLAWHALLIEQGFKNPAIFALDYALVPDESYPTQVNETVSGYKHALSVVRDPRKLCVAGDSAGATLVLTMLMELGRVRADNIATKKTEVSAVTGSTKHRDWPAASDVPPLPAMAILISPWVTLISPKHDNSTSDYLDSKYLHKYAVQYAGVSHVGKAAASPGLCEDSKLWEAASPPCGFFITWGTEEVFAQDIKDFIQMLVKSRVEVDGRSEEGGIHAWPVASLFLSGSEEQRLKGLRTLTSAIRQHFLYD